MKRSWTAGRSGVLEGMNHFFKLGNLKPAPLTSSFFSETSSSIAMQISSRVYDEHAASISEYAGVALGGENSKCAKINTLKADSLAFASDNCFSFSSFLRLFRNQPMICRVIHRSPRNAAHSAITTPTLAYWSRTAETSFGMVKDCNHDSGERPQSKKTGPEHFQEITHAENCQLRRAKNQV